MSTVRQVGYDPSRVGLDGIPGDRVIDRTTGILWVKDGDGRADWIPGNKAYGWNPPPTFSGGSGAPGPQGPAGSPGAKGDQGQQGPEGPPGSTGAAGPQGPQGNAGPQGNPGDPGFQGPQGPKGDTGNPGTQGPQGIQGIQGPQGNPGTSGDPLTLFRIGFIYTTIVATNPSTFFGGTWLQIAQGRCLVGQDTGDPQFDQPGETSGSKTSTPAGSVSAPTFTGTSSQNTSAITAGTPAGTNSAPAFTGSPLSGHAHGPGTLVPSAHAGTAVGDHASHTHTYTQVPNHVHVERAQGGTTASTTGTHLMTSTATGGSLRSSAASTLDPTGGTATGTTNGPGATMTHAVTQPSAHTMSGTSESISGGTPAGTVAAPAFTGTQLGTHQHTITATGTNSAPTFTGSPMSVVQPSFVVYFFQRTA